MTPGIPGEKKKTPSNMCIFVTCVPVYVLKIIPLMMITKDWMGGSVPISIGGGVYTFGYPYMFIRPLEDYWLLIDYCYIIDKIGVELYTYI